MEYRKEHKVFFQSTHRFFTSPCQPSITPLKMKKTALFILLISTMAFISSCDKCDDENGIICTQEFRIIKVSLDNGTQQPVTLDDAYTLRQGSTNKIYFDQPFPAGTYVVMDDSYHQNLKNSEAQFRFIGVKNNQVVVDKSYVIGADNCHIIKKSGADSVLVQ
jgi:hypothetical protein